MFLFFLLGFLLGPAVFASKANPQTMLETAMELYEKGEYEAALMHYQSFQKKYPKDPRRQAVQLMIAECMREVIYGRETTVDAGDLLLFRDPRVIKEYEKAVKLNDHPALTESAAFRIVEMLYNSGSYNEAAFEWEQFLDRYPDSYLRAEALLSLCRTLAMLRRWDELDQMLGELTRLNAAYSEEDEVRYLQGLAHFAKNRFEKAHESFESIQLPTAPSLFYSGKSLLQQAKPLVAARKFQQLLQKFPKHPLAEEARYLLAECFFTAGDYLGAILDFEQFLQAHPESFLAAAATYKIGLAHFARENYFDARGTFEQIVANKTGTEFAPLAQYLIGETYRKQNQLKEASFAYGEMANRFVGHPYSGNALYKFAWCSHLAGNFSASEAALKKMILTYPGHTLIPYANTLLGHSLSRQEKYEEAALAYQRAVDLAFPSDPGEAALALGNRAMLAAQNYNSLISAYHLILNNYPPSANPWRALTYLYIAEGYFRSGLYKEAINVYRTILRLYPASPAAAFAQDGVAWAYFKMGFNTEAEAERAQMKHYQDDPNLGKDYLATDTFEMGNILFNRKKYAQALEKYEAFARDYPENKMAPQAKFRAGLCYAQLNYHGQAIESWEALRRLYPETPSAAQAAWKIADTYFRAARYDDSIAVYREILQKYPEDGELSFARLRIAQGYYNSRRWAQAVEAFQELIFKHPDDARAKEALEFLAGLLEQPESKTEAIAALRKIAKDLGPQSALGAEAQFRIAQNAFEAKNYENAAKEIEKLSGTYLETDWLAEKEYYLGESYYQLQRFKDAAGCFERLLSNFPQDQRIPFVLFRLGSVHFKLENFQAAAAAFDRLAKEFPASDYAANAAYNAALSYKKAKLYGEAKTALAGFMRTYPDKAKESQAPDEMVNLYEETKDYASANKLLDEMRQTENPAGERYGEITFRIADNFLRAGDSAQAVLEYEKLRSAGAPRSQWRMNAAIKLVELYEKSEQWTKAAKIYQEIIQEAGKPEWVQAAKARLDFIRSNHPEAFLKAD